MKTVRIACVVLACGLAACASEAEREFGSSVRNMIAGQKDDPSPATPERSGTDGQKAANALEAYRAMRVDSGQGGHGPHGGGQHSAPAQQQGSPQ